MSEQKSDNALVRACGDSSAWLLPEDGFSFFVEPERARLTVLKLAKTEGGRRVYIRHRVVTGNEYRVWQQTGNVPLTSEDAGSSPADGSNPCQNAEPIHGEKDA